MTEPALAADVAETVEAVLDAAPPDIVATMRELGWSDLRAELGHRADEIYFLGQGRRLAVSRMLDEVAAAVLGTDARGFAYVVDQDPDGTVHAVTGATVATGTELPALGSHDGSLLAVTDQWAPGGVDPSSGWRLLTGRLAGPPTEEASAAVRLALSWELVGVAEGMLEIALEHVRTRSQFGRPLAAFQAVKHRMADCRVSIEAARAACRAGFGSAQASLTAKALAAEAAETTARHTQQVCGAMGMTEEFPLHRHVRRAMALGPVTGTRTACLERLGVLICRTREDLAS